MPTNILTLQSPDMALIGCDFAFVPTPGKTLGVHAIRGTFDARIDPALNGRPLNIGLFQSYGLPWDAWAGAHTPVPTEPEGGWQPGVPNADGWYLDSNNVFENVQEYRRYWHAATGRAYILFHYQTAFEVLKKADVRPIRIGGVDIVTTVVPYGAAGADLTLRGDAGERIEVWQEGAPVKYTQTDGADIAVCAVAVEFRWR